ncbi:peptide ABC transporter substrate-binding protein [Thalassobaculum fulvum]|uniref:Peptide ABC transporter substrate-binding protein n=1 Tax=Thalassobaculum fulvum TaxID=1633335 RepID=A0A918XV86_9PROT|nr:ABC transporter substrate-binding protein [Thalassobaculum fulvum]GHD58607.1 peptide ABC transporter substrate-binding protein [Thalassobaculum fulvum]
MTMLHRLGAVAIAFGALTTPVLAEDITIGIAAEPSSMDPYFHNLGPNNSMIGHTFERLIEFDSNQQLMPGLATEWKPVSDTVWELKLRKGTKFHDGSDFTADDVLFSFERADQYTGGNSSFRTYTKGKTVTKVDDHTIRISTAAPYPLMPNDLTTVMIMSSDAKGTGEAAKNKGIEAKDFNDGTAAIGTGPYTFVEWKKGESIVFAKNEAYNGNLHQPFDKVTFKFIPAAPARVAALIAGDVDMIDNVPTVDIARLKKDSKLNLSQGVSNRVIYLHMDQFRDQSPFVTTVDGQPLDKNPLKDAKVRKALSLLINRKAIVDRVMEGVAIPAGQLLPDGFFGRSPNLTADPYDPKGAKSLLAEAGWGKGFGLTVHGPNDRYINDAKILEAVGQMFTANGIPTKVETMTKNVFFSRASKGGPDNTPEFSLILVGWGSGTGEASSPLKSLLATHDPKKGWGASNRGRHSSPEMDALLAEALSTVDDKRRGELLAEATDIGIGGDQGIIPLHYQVNTWATRKGLAYNARTDERTVAYDVIVEK